MAFTTEHMSKLVIEVFDLAGRLVCTLLNEKVPEGRHVIKWDASRFHDGVYILKIPSGTYVLTRKIIKSG
ncbi:MAG: T9SS type A sorting domain-containing protein [Bacteroidales bacterium]|nr:T9SS type A sorting domain-containing protein [Bacteroidales bacterium]